MNDEETNGPGQLTEEQFDRLVNADTFFQPRQGRVQLPVARGLLDYINRLGRRPREGQQFTWQMDEIVPYHQEYPQTATELMITEPQVRRGEPNHGFRFTPYISEEELERRLAGLGILMPQTPGGRGIIMNNITRYGHPCGNLQTTQNDA